MCGQAVIGNLISRISTLLLLAVLLLGFFLRVHALGAQSFWLDEAYTWAIAGKSWREMWSSMLALSDVSPLPYVVSKLTSSLTGLSEFGLRLPFALVGWLAIPVTYQAGRELAGRSVGVLAAAIVALSPFAVWYARDARPYGLYLLLAALVLCGFLRVERGKGWGLFVASSAMLYLTHYVSALFAYAQAGYLLTRLRSQPLLLRKWAAAQAVAVLPVSGWVIAFLVSRQPLIPNPWIPSVTPYTIFQTLWNFVSGDAQRWSFPTVVGVAVVVGLAVAGYWRVRTGSAPPGDKVTARESVGGARMPSVRRSVPEERANLLVWWLVLPPLAGWLFSLRLPAYVDRFFLPSILPLALLMAAGLLALLRFWRAVVIPLALVGLLSGSVRLWSDPQYAKEDWRGAAWHLEGLGLPVGLDEISYLGLMPYLSPNVKFALARNEYELSWLAEQGRFALILRSPHESAHALSKSAPFDPLTEGPAFFRQWLEENRSAPIQIHSFTGLAVILIGK